MQKRLLVLPFLAITLGGCSLPFVGNKNVVEQVAQKTEEKAAEQAILQNCKYEKDVCQYYAAMIGAYSNPMVMKATTTMKNGEVTVATTKMDGKGNMDMVSTSKGKEESAMIFLDKVTYIKDYKDNTWMKMAASEDEKSPSLFDPQAAVETFKEEAESIKDTMTIKKLGEEACGSLTCLKYQMDESTLGTSTIVWFDTKEHKSRKMETKTSGVTNLVEFSYEQVTITAPSPVKDAPDYSKMMNDSGAKMPSADELKKMMEQMPQGVDQGENGDE
jgi:hypothetical protein